MSTNTLRSTFNNVRVDEEDEFICGFRMRDFLVQKKTSPYYGTRFYACAKFSQDPTRCRTTIWFDEKEHVRSLIPPTMQSPRTPRKQIDIRIFGQYTPPTTLKRKAGLELFNSGVGDLVDNKLDSPSMSRSAKKLRYGYADAATQTGDSTLPASASRPSPKPIPRRRLFDDVLSTPKNKPPTILDPFAPQALDNNKNIFNSSIMAPIRKPRRSSLSPTKPATLPCNHPRAVTSSTGRYDQMNPPRANNSTTPPALKCGRTGLFIHPAEKHAQGFSPQPESDEPKTPTRSNNKTRHQSTDSDNDTYGWTDDLEQNILEVMDSIENPQFSPLFV